MATKKFQSAVWDWLKITLAAFLLMLAVIFVLPPITILRVPSFVIGNGMSWLLRWEREPGVRFAVSFNPVTLMALAAVIGLVGVWSGVNRRRRNLRRDRRQ